MHRIRYLIAILLLLTGLSYAQDPCGGLSTEDCALLSSVPAAMNALTAARFDLTFAFSGPEETSVSFTVDGAYQLEGTGDLLTGLDSELNVSFTISESLNSLGLSTEASNGALNLVLVDGIGYLNFDALDLIAGGIFSAQGYTGWGGVELAPIIAQLDPNMIAQSATGLTEALSPDSFAQVQPYLTLTRAENQDGLAVFEASFDTAAMMDDPALALRLRDGLLQVLGSVGQDEIDLMIEVFRTSTLTALIRIDPATRELHALQVTWDLDFSAPLTAMGEDDGPMPVTFNLMLTVSEFNTATINAPEGATIGTEEDLRGLFDQFFSFGVN